MLTGVLVVAGALHAPARAEDDPLLLQPGETEGAAEVSVVGGNLVSARARAMDRARQDAVARVVAGHLPEEKLTALASTLRGAIYKRHRAYVRRYRVIEEGREGKRFRVRLAVLLDTKRLLRDLSRLLGQGSGAGTVPGRPPVCLAVQGQTLALALAQGLAAAGFSTRSSPGPGCGATLVGSVTSEDAPGVRGLGLAGARARAAVKATLVGDGAVLAERTGQGFGAADSAARARRLAEGQATERVVAPVVAALERQWPRSLASSGSQLLRVTGATSLGQYDAIRGFLQRRAPGVRKVVPVRFARGELWLAVTGGRLPDLGRLLASNDFQTFRLQSRGARGGTLWLEVTQ